METTIKSEKSLFITAAEVSEIMGVSKAYAYRIIKQLNNELSQKGFLVIQGKTSKKFFNERIYGKE